MADKDKQLRSRVTPDQHETLTNAASDAGMNLSDYVRSVLLDSHVLIVLGAPDDNGSLFRLVPAYSSVESERAAALANLEGLLQLGAELQAQLQAAAAVGEDEALPTPSPEPGRLPDSPVASPVAPAEPVPAPAAPTPPPQAPVAAVPEPEQLVGPTPGPEETADAFMERRIEELRTTGLSAMRASLEAEAEWRASLAQAAPSAAPPALATSTPPTGPPPMVAFCPHCGAGDTGGNFCTGCGSQLRQLSQ